MPRRVLGTGVVKIDHGCVRAMVAEGCRLRRQPPPGPIQSLVGLTPKGVTELLAGGLREAKVRGRPLQQLCKLWGAQSYEKRVDIINGNRVYIFDFGSGLSIQTPWQELEEHRWFRKHVERSVNTEIVFHFVFFVTGVRTCNTRRC